MPSTEGAAWTPVRAVLTGWLVVGSLDICEVIIFYAIRNGVAPSRIFQSVAAGWYGRDAFTGGMRTAVVGGLSHYFIALCVVSVFYLGSRLVPALRRYPVPTGMAYGLVVMAVMNLVVIPLSAASMPHWTPLTFGNQVFCHLFCIGMPAAAFVRRAYPPGFHAGLPAVS